MCVHDFSGSISFNQTADSEKSESTVLQPGLVTEAAGSAYIEAGKTKLICAV